MLGKLLTLAIILTAAYLVVTRALPLLERSGGGHADRLLLDPDSQDGRCVEQAESANDRLITAARQHGQPPVDVDGWSSSTWEIESQLQAAAATCMCGSTTCREANLAIEEMHQLLTNLDGMVRGDAAGFANPANQQERIFRHLESARAAADS